MSQAELLIVTSILGFCNCCYVVRYFVSILVLQSSRSGCFALFVFLVYRDFCAALPHDCSLLLLYFLIILTILEVSIFDLILYLHLCFVYENITRFPYLQKIYVQF